MAAESDLASILNTLSSYSQGDGRSVDQQAAQRVDNSLRASTVNQSTHHLDGDDVDHRTITDWSTALRYVTKRTSKDSNIGLRISKMIKNQANHERDWWQGRVMLIESFKERSEGSEELDNILGSLGATVPARTAQSTAGDEKAALQHYDTSVHKAQTLMNEDMLARLIDLRIPFFGTDSTLLCNEVDASSSKLSKIKHQGLQLRMLEHLRDLFAE